VGTAETHTHCGALGECLSMLSRKGMKRGILIFNLGTILYNTWLYAYWSMQVDSD
jgi:hypothetical protein